jgi:hypothetical protein
MDIDIPATLYLNTSQINTDPSVTNTSNQIGTWTNSRETFSFNVKMRQLLGNAYEKYDKFIISVVNVFLLNQAAMSSAILTEVQIGGLSWVNSSYDQTSQANNFWTSISIHNQPLAIGSFTNNVFDILSNTLVFSKGDADVQLQFRLLNATTRLVASTATGYLPTVGVTLKIHPVVEK